MHSHPAQDRTGCSWNPVSQIPNARHLTTTLSPYPRQVLLIELPLCAGPWARIGGYRDEEDRPILRVISCTCSLLAALRIELR